MTPYADSDLSLVVRIIPMSRVEEYVATGWVERAQYYRNGWQSLVEWPFEQGKPIEPKESEQ